jgi:hypothetical protein
MIILFYLTIVFYLIARAGQEILQHEAIRKMWRKFFYVCAIIAGLLASICLLISLWDQIKAAIH